MSIVLNSCITLVGAYAGGYITYRPAKTNSPYDFNFSAFPGAITGAFAAPVAYHLAKPMISSISQQGVVKALHNAPNLLAAGLGAAGLFAGAAIVGGVVGGNLTSNPNIRSSYDFSGGLDALPGFAVGVVAGPLTHALARSALGPVPGSVAFLVLAVGLANYRKLNR